MVTHRSRRSTALRSAVLLGTALALARGVDFPLKIGSDDIEYYAETYDIDGLQWALESVFNLSHRVRGDAGDRPLLEAQVAMGGGAHYTTAYKLRCDLEQVKQALKIQKYGLKYISPWVYHRASRRAARRIGRRRPRSIVSSQKKARSVGRSLELVDVD